LIGIILVEDSDRPGYPSYFLSREFELLGLARIIQTSSKAYGYSLAHFKAWQLIRLAKRR